MLYKNLSDQELSHVMRVRFFLDYLAAFQMLVLGRSLSDFKAVVKARRDFCKWKKNFTADRRHIQETRLVPVGCINGIFDFSILWKYYAKGKKVFSSLKK